MEEDGGMGFSRCMKLRLFEQDLGTLEGTLVGRHANHTLTSPKTLSNGPPSRCGLPCRATSR